MKIVRVTLCLLLLPFGLWSAPAYSGEWTTVTRKGRCLLQVDGKTYISGKCKYDMTVRDSDGVHISTPGSFTIRDLSVPRADYAAYVEIDLKHPTIGEGGWNEELGAGHMQTPLGTLHRDGACWVNKRVRICLWRK